MMSCPSSSSDDTAVNIILEKLSCCFESTYAELLANLVLQSSFKQLKRLGEQQFFNATESTHTMEEQSQRIKMQFAKINQLAVSADNIIDTVIKEKFQSNFVSMLKEEVLKIILKLHADKDSFEEKSISAQPLQAAGSPEEKKIDNVKIMLEKLTDVSKYFADFRKQVIGMSFENTACVSENPETALSNAKEDNIEENDNDDIELGNTSFDSVSSVHTSDLSSFCDEISISSDEETGKKRKKLSLKLAKEEVEQIRVKRGEKNNGKQVFSTKPKNSESEILTNDSSSVQQKSLPQRLRKPNSKYNAVDIISPLKTKSTEKAIKNKSSTSIKESEISKSLHRKRGRPRKNV